MNKTLLLVLGLFSLCAYSQPTVTSAIIPAAGDSIHFVRCAPANAQDDLVGANQVWDFSSLTPHATSPAYYFKFVDPADAPDGARYPDAFLAATAPDTQWIYYAFDGTTLELVGAVAEVPFFGTAFADYDNRETETVFPMQNGTTWNDNFSGENVAGGFNIPFSGTISGEVDGYGTLILPTGTYENVLRNGQERTYQLQGAPAETSTLWIYSAPNIGLWLLSIEEFSNGGEPLVYYADAPVIISQTREAAAFGQISIHPNPVRAGQKLTVKSASGPVKQVLLLDVYGRQIQSTEHVEIDYFELPQHLPSGTYFMLVKNETGHFFEKIMVAE